MSPVILGIESSCDETCAAIIEGRVVRSNVVASQIEMHLKWGGVVPEAAARAHLESIIPVIDEAVESSGISWAAIEAIAVTNRPGLVGALSVGVTAAKALALQLGIPLIGVHHLEGHLSSTRVLDVEPPLPHVSLIVSGGHTELVLVRAWGDYEIIGETRDDAAGEAFDKSARLLGLGYPGGRAIQQYAEGGNPKRYSLPRGLRNEGIDFSFSGLKTAVARLIEKEGDSIHLGDACASIQHAIVEVLAEKTLRALESHSGTFLTLVGGVAANASLRNRLKALCALHGVGFATPPVEMCTDNAAMIALAALRSFEQKRFDDFSLDVYPNATLPAIFTTY